MKTLDFLNTVTGEIYEDFDEACMKDPTLQNIKPIEGDSELCFDMGQMIDDMRHYRDRTFDVEVTRNIPCIIDAEHISLQWQAEDVEAEMLTNQTWEQVWEVMASLYQNKGQAFDLSLTVEDGKPFYTVLYARAWENLRGERTIKTTADALEIDLHE